MIKNRTRTYGICKFLLILPLILILFSSCRSKKIITDASKFRNVKLKGSLKERYSSILEVSEREIKNQKLYKFIDEWMGVPYASGEMNKKGVDCSGFTCMLQKEIYGKNLPRTSRQMAENLKRKYEGKLQEGDLVFFDFNGQKYSHVGVYLMNNKFVHASTSRGIIISDLKDPWYYKYFSRGGSARD
ncbi:C40 family peptidase [Rubrolithibacter danxiaensis]|uniref:C40 family peptidase n=1 Tax=Rubrolithibacter danxiaensis TaxID=3390805 RepID=UPI003BF90D77